MDAGEAVAGISLSSGCRYLVSAGSQGLVKVWDLKRKDMVKSYPGHTDALTCVSFNPKDDHVASGSVSGTVLLHSVSTGQCNATLTTAVASAIRTLEYAWYSRLTKSWLATGDDDGSINIWDCNQAATAVEFHSQHYAPCTGVAFSPLNHMLLASVGLDKRVLFYDTHQRKRVKVVDGDAPIQSLAFHQDGHTVAVGTTTGRVMLYDLRQGNTPTHNLAAHIQHPVTCVQFEHNTLRSSTSLKSLAARDATINPSPLHRSASSGAVASSAAASASASSSGAAAGSTTTAAPRSSSSTADLFSPVRSSAPAAAARSKAAPASASDLFSPVVPRGAKPSAAAPAPAATSSSASAGVASSAAPSAASTLFSPVASTATGNDAAAAAPSASGAGGTGDGAALFSPLQPRNLASTSATTPASQRASARVVATPSPHLPIAPARKQAWAEDEETPTHTPAPAAPPSTSLGTIDKDAAAADCSDTQRDESFDAKQPPTAAAAPAEMADKVGVFNAQLIESVVEERMASIRDLVHQDVQNVHLEMLRQFHIQQRELTVAMQEEMRALRLENQRLMAELAAGGASVKGFFAAVERGS